MELKEGKMTFRELSQWFGLSPDTLSKHPKLKEKRLQTLKAFADYHFEKRSIFIDKVYIPTYSTAYEEVHRTYPKYWTRLSNGELIDTCKDVGQKIHENEPTVNKQIGESSTVGYVNRAKIADFGKNGSSGPMGNALNAYVDPRTGGPLSEHDREIFNQVLKEVFAEDDEQKLGLLEDWTNGVITKDEYEKGLQEIRLKNKYNFWEIRLKITEALGYYPKKKTKLEPNAWSSEMFTANEVKTETLS